MHGGTSLHWDHRECSMYIGMFLYYRGEITAKCAVEPFHCTSGGTSLCWDHRECSMYIGMLLITEVKLYTVESSTAHLV